MACAKNLQAALEKYQPRKYVIIEFPKIEFSDNELSDVINKTVTNKNGDNKLFQIVKSNLFLQFLKNKSSDVYSFLKNNSYVKLIRKQVEEHMNTNKQNVEKKDFDTMEQAEGSKTLNNAILLNEVLQKMRQEAEGYGVKIIIVCHPHTILNSDGSISFSFDAAMIEQLKDLCLHNGLYFLDMRERFMEEYQDNHVLPYGFINTSVGSGHLNKYGHAMLAEELYKLIQKIEGVEQ